MKRILFSLSAVLVMVGLVGCAADRACRTTSCCPNDGCAATCSCGQSCDNACCDPNACEDDCGMPLFWRLRSWWNRERCCDQPCEGQMCAEPCYPQGPQTGQVTYPYYTTRGPRDFLAKDPASIGP